MARSDAWKKLCHHTYYHINYRSVFSLTRRRENRKIKRRKKWKILSDQRNLFTQKSSHKKKRKDKKNEETSRREDTFCKEREEEKKKTNCSIKFEHLLGDGLTAMCYVGAFQEGETSHTKYRPETVYLGIPLMRIQAPGEEITFYCRDRPLNSRCDADW